MQRPDPIEITSEDAEKLRKLNALRVGNASFVEQMRQAGERRNAELVQQGTAIWSELAEKYKLDVQHVGYDLAQDGSNTLVAVQASFV